MFNNINYIINKLSNIIKVESLLKMILNNIKSVNLDKSDTVINITRKSLDIKENDKSVSILIEKNKITYSFNLNDEHIIGEYIINKNFSFIKENEISSIEYNSNNNIYHNINKKETFRLFDENNIEIFKRYTYKQDNYYEDKDTKEITLPEPDIMENYTDTTYIWRKDNEIIQRNIRKYIDKNNTKAFITIKDHDYCTLRMNKLYDKQKEIPNFGTYYGFDNDIFYSYMKKEATIDDIHINLKTKNYKKPSQIIF